MPEEVVVEARDIESAVAEGARMLGLDENAVEYFVEYAGNPGFLGFIGRKPARVRVAPIGGGVSEPKQRSKSTSGRGQQKQRGQQERGRCDDDRRSGGGARGARDNNRKPPERGAKNKQRQEQQSRKQTSDNNPKPERPAQTRQPKQSVAPKPKPKPERVFNGVKGEDSELVERVVKHITQIFNLDVEVSALQDEQQVLVKIQGDAGALIGRRGKTVAALQYMVGRIINEDREVWKRVLIDIDGYRSDREEELRRRAEKAAEACVSEDRWIQLPSMSSQDRRFIHMVLQEHDLVRTESIGQGDNRRVVVIPKDSSISVKEIEAQLDDDDFDRDSRSDDNTGSQERTSQSAAPRRSNPRNRRSFQRRPRRK